MERKCKVCGNPVIKSRDLCRTCFDNILVDMQAYAEKFELQERERKVKLRQERIGEIYKAGSSFIDVHKFEELPRICLRCEREFLAEGRFNRICYRCKPRAFRQPWEQDVI